MRYPLEPDTRSAWGVHKKYLKSDVAMCEHQMNCPQLSPTSLASLVTAHKIEIWTNIFTLSRQRKDG